ncbi:MAG: nucleoside phosphorylase [Anaerolineaceae bacterium]|nr:nucleoside phosphorylase [Anaerolineaceae bacterium]
MKDDEGLQYHVKVRPGDVGRYVLLPGDPGRVEKMADYLDDPQFISFNREHKVYTGTLLGEKVSVVSTGMGCPSTAIAVEELVAVGADTFIRVGTSGAVQPGLKLGDVAVVTGAIRDEGTTPQYLPIEYPAIADIEVVNALAEGSKRVGASYHLGVSHTKDSFYGEIEPDRMPMASHLKERWKAWEAGGAICSEMEAAAIFILSSIYRKRAGGVMMIIGSDTETLLQKKHDPDVMIHAAIEGIRILIRQDRAKQAAA